MLSISTGKRSSIWPCSFVFLFCPKSKSMVLRKTQFPSLKKQKNKKKLLVVSYRKKENPNF